MIVYRLYWWSVDIDLGNDLVHKPISHYLVLSWLNPKTLCGVTRLMQQDFRASNDLINNIMMTSSYGNSFLVTGPLWGESAGYWSRGAFMFSVICAWTNGWANNHDAGDSRPHCVHYDVTVMIAVKNFKRYETCNQKHWTTCIFPLMPTKQNPVDINARLKWYQRLSWETNGCNILLT